MAGSDGHATVEMGSERSFGVVFAVVFSLIGLWPLLHGNGPRAWALLLAVAFLGLGYLAPQVLRPLNVWWFKLGLLLGRIVAPVVMTLLFFLVVTPTAVIMRALGKDLLKLKLDPAAKSYWIERTDNDQPAGSMRNQF